MTRTPLLWVFHSLWSYILATAVSMSGMVFLILGLRQWMFVLERMISMFDSFLCGCCRLGVSCDFFFLFPGRAAVNHAVWLVYIIPGAVSYLRDGTVRNACHRVDQETKWAKYKGNIRK